jgi:hypothetical protein
MHLYFKYGGMMKNLKKLFILTVAFAFSSVFAQASDSTQYISNLSQAKPVEKRVYYGGELGVSGLFDGNYLSLSVRPFVGYRVTPELHAGVKLMYQYISDDRYTKNLTSNNYGASLFSRYFLVPQLYAHGELAGLSYERWRNINESERVTVPLLFLGAGYLQQIAPGVALNVEVLYDVLQDSNSPYESGDVQVSVGVWAGL